MRVRGLVHGTLLIVAGAAIVWAVALTLFGGVNTTILGIRIRSNDPSRACLVALLGIVAYLLSGGSLRHGPLGRSAAAIWGATHTLLATGSRHPALIGVAIATTVAVSAAAGSTRIAGSSDAYGYVSQADLWLSGSLVVRQPWVAQVPWPEAEWTFTPLGYRPAHGSEPGTIAPTYSPGLPMLMAGAKWIGGQCALFMVVPLCLGLGVLATYGIGSRLGSRWSGVIGALLVATSPALLVVSFESLTDVPVMSAWAVAFYWLLGVTDSEPARRGRNLALVAGLAAGVAILIRPNLVLLAVPLGLWLLGRRATLRSRLVSACVFALGALPGILAVAFINNHLYGSPAMSGYGSFEDQFAWSHVGPNLRRYLSWFTYAQTPIAFAGIAALVLPARRIWPGVADRRVLWTMAMFVAILWTQYFAYLEFDSWGYLRFLLPSWPLIMVGLGATIQALHASMPLPPVTRSVVCAIGVIALAAWTLGIASRSEVFGQRRPAAHEAPIGQLVRQHTADNSVVLVFERSGSIRYYSGRTTLRYDFLPGDWLDRSVAWLTERGVHVYAVLDPGHEDQVRQRFAGQRTLAALQRPVWLYEPTRTALFDLSTPPSPTQSLLLFERDPGGRAPCDPPVEPTPIVLR